jgi:hypothetical protein
VCVFIAALVMNLDKIKRIFSMVRLLADNAHGGITGVHGSVNPRAVAAIFRAMDIFGSNFVDAGAGNGVVMACAIANGAGKATGYELPENDAHRKWRNPKEGHCIQSCKFFALLLSGFSLRDLM